MDPAPGPVATVTILAARGGARAVHVLGAGISRAAIDKSACLPEIRRSGLSSARSPGPSPVHELRLQASWQETRRLPDADGRIGATVREPSRARGPPRLCSGFSDATDSTGDLLGLAGSFLHSARNFLTCRLLLFDAASNRRGNSVDPLDGPKNPADRIDGALACHLPPLNLLRDLNGCRLIGETLDLARHHRKPPACCSGARGPDGRIKAKKNTSARARAKARPGRISLFYSSQGFCRLGSPRQMVEMCRNRTYDE
jgi:hypothetical protein